MYYFVRTFRFVDHNSMADNYQSDGTTTGATPSSATVVLAQESSSSSCLMRIEDLGSIWFLRTQVCVILVHRRTLCDNICFCQRTISLFHHMVLHGLPTLIKYTTHTVPSLHKSLSQEVFKPNRFHKVSFSIYIAATSLVNCPALRIVWMTSGKSRLQQAAIACLNSSPTSS